MEERNKERKKNFILAGVLIAIITIESLAGIWAYVEAKMRELEPEKRKEYYTAASDEFLPDVKHSYDASTSSDTGTASGTDTSTGSDTGTANSTDASTSSTGDSNTSTVAPNNSEDSYDAGYEDVYLHGDYDPDRYSSDEDYANGVDDAMDEEGEDW